MIVEIGADYVILDVYDEYGVSTGDHIRHTITPDTPVSYEAPFEAGKGNLYVVRA